MKYQIAILLLSSATVLGQIATPTFNPFNNGRMPFYGFNQMMPQQGHYNQQRPNNNFMTPNNYGFQNNYPQQQFLPQQQQQFLPQQQQQQQQQQQFLPQQQQQNNFQQQQQNNVPLFTRRFYLNNGYLYGRSTLYYDPKTGKFQTWVRRNLR